MKNPREDYFEGNNEDREIDTKTDDQEEGVPTARSHNRNSDYSLLSGERSAL
jgi:hypothetical protein